MCTITFVCQLGNNDDFWVLCYFPEKKSQWVKSALLREKKKGSCIGALKVSTNKYIYFMLSILQINLHKYVLNNNTLQMYF